MSTVKKHIWFYISTYVKKEYLYDYGVMMRGDKKTLYPSHKLLGELAEGGNVAFIKMFADTSKEAVYGFQVYIFVELYKPATLVWLMSLLRFGSFGPDKRQDVFDCSFDMSVVVAYHFDDKAKFEDHLRIHEKYETVFIRGKLLRPMADEIAFPPADGVDELGEQGKSSRLSS